MTPQGQAVGDSGRQMADSFNAAAKMYADNPTAFHLRAMNMLYEAWIPERSATRLREADLNVLSKLGK
jgi:hypothetical protein